MRGVVVRGAVVAVAMCVSLVFAGGAAASGTALQFRATGPGAEALFTTLPASGIPVPGTVYTDTYVTGSSTITGIGTGKSLDHVLLLDEFSYTFEGANLNQVPVSDTSGYADGSAVALSISQKLASASASATVPLTTCVFDASGNATCGPAVPTAVSASWTGQGSLQKQVNTSVFHTKGTTVVSKFRGSLRNATGSLQVGGTSVAAPLGYADIFDSTQKSTCISHPGGCQGP